MKLWKEQMAIAGYANYMEDRMQIMMLHKKAMLGCFNKFNNVTNKMKRLIGIYQCELPILEGTVQKFRTASEKCSNTQFPEKCQTFYTKLIPQFEYKIKFNNAQLDTLKRKMGLTQYD